MKNALKFKQTYVPRQSGELARLKVIQGPDSGCVFVLTGQRALIGRGEENDIVLTDLKASRSHAEIVWINHSWNVKDLGSSNGILHNQVKTLNAVLKTQDIIHLGETILEFFSAEANSDLLVAPPRSLDEAEKHSGSSGEQDNLTKRLFSSLKKSSGQKSKQKQMMIWAIGGIGLAFFLLMDSPDPKTKKTKKAPEADAPNLASYLPSVEVNRVADSIFKEGFREFNQGNLNRARTQFETVLQISPGHSLATLYLENCNKQIEEEIKINKDQGKRSFEAGKLKDARIHYKRILRLLSRDRTNPDYIEAKGQCELTEKEMNLQVSTCEGDKSP